MATFQRMLLDSLHLIGGLPCGATPVASGPRYCGQLASASFGGSSALELVANVAVQAITSSAGQAELFRITTRQGASLGFISRNLRNITVSRARVPGVHTFAMSTPQLFNDAKKGRCVCRTARPMLAVPALQATEPRIIVS